MKELTGKKNVSLTKRGNASILSVLKFIKAEGVSNLIIPDQGGWLTYSQYSKKLKFNSIELKTELGVINTTYLEMILKENQSSAMIMSSLAAYYVAQPVERIYELCKKYDCILINDVTASIGFNDLLKGDIVLGSFGKNKPVDLGKAGFIASDFEIETIPAELNSDELEELLEKINDLDNRMQFLLKKREEVLKDLEKYDILNKNAVGINVIVKFSNEKEKQDLIDYCDKNKLDYKICPMYIKVKTDAIDIEIINKKKN